MVEACLFRFERQQGKNLPNNRAMKGRCILVILGGRNREKEFKYQRSHIFTRARA